KQLGLNVKFMGGDGVCTGEMPKLAGDGLADDQVYCAEAGGVDDAGKPAMDKFRADYKAKFNDDVKLYAPYVYDATKLMVEAMVRAGSSDPAKYLPELKATNHQGV